MEKKTGQKSDRRKESDLTEAETLQLERMEGETCRSLRGLWEEVFSEDSKKFTDYYFQEKAVRNRGYALQSGEGTAAMLYLSPYPVMLRSGNRFECREINYIVGVATKEEYRHRGFMDRILKTALRDMYGKRQPFTFLMPADPAIYRPYQFGYIYVKEEYDRNKTAVKQPAGAEWFPRLAEFVQDFLEKHYDVFIRRDEAYYQVMEKELQAQDGGICTVTEEGRLRGCFLYTQENGKEEIQEAVFDRENGGSSPVVPAGTEKPMIMARIVEAGTMLSLLRAKSGEAVFCIRMSDPILDGNTGVWECILGEEQAEVRRTEAELKAASAGTDTAKSRKAANISMEALISWIFGCQEAEEGFWFESYVNMAEREEILCQLHNVKRLEKVFLNEIV